MINIIINGENKNIKKNSTLQQIIIDLKIEDKVMAAAINMDIIKKDNWATFIPKENDKLELLQFVGGG
jgi:sulfur carrier protein